MRPSTDCRLYDYSTPPTASTTMTATDAPSTTGSTGSVNVQQRELKEQQLHRQMSTAYEQLNHMLPTAGRWNDLSADMESLITVVDYIHRLESEWYDVQREYRASVASLQAQFAQLSASASETSSSSDSTNGDEPMNTT